MAARESVPVVGLVVATELEARPFLTRYFRAEGVWAAAGRRWFLGGVRPTNDLAPPADAAGQAARGARAADGGERTRRAVLVISGYDKANAAAATTLLLERFAPVLVINFGIAGAFPSSGLTLGDVVLATADSYADTGTSSPQGWLPAEELGLPLAEVGGKRYWNTFPLEPELVRAAVEALRRGGWEVDGTGHPVADATARGSSQASRVRTGPCVTLSQVTGTAEEARALEDRWHALAESMEGAACAHMCAAYGVPFLEVRGVSNRVGDRDRSGWDVRGAAARAAEAVAALCGDIPGLLRE